MLSRYSKYFLLMLMIPSCKKDEISFSNVPSIEFTSISPTTAHQYIDPIVIAIKYKDGNGDLGENSTSAVNCFVTDNRMGITYKLRIQQLAPENANIPIEGSLNINIGGQIIADSSNSQSATYSLYLTDRAGNKSNTISTSAINIIR